MKCQKDANGTFSVPSHGSQTDLMEALHTAYLFGNLHNDQGQPCTFKEIVNHACRRLFAHPVPSNPTALASRGRYRKGVKRQSFFDRYCLLQSHGKGCRPLLQLVSKAPERHSTSLILLPQRQGNETARSPMMESGRSVFLLTFTSLTEEHECKKEHVHLQAEYA